MTKTRSKKISRLISSIEELIEIAAITPEDSKIQVESFREAINESDEPCKTGYDLMWALKDGWQCGYYVDWKDRENFIGSIDALSEERGIKIDWGTGEPYDDEFLRATDIPKLMQIAWTQLAAQGWTLWEWQSGMDSYAGWISRSSDDHKIYHIARLLQEDFHPAVSLNAAARDGDTKKVKALLSARANPDEPDLYGWTPLMWAAYNGKTSMVKLLLAAGAKVNLANKNGWTALHKTVIDPDVPKRDYPAIAALLLEAGADINQKNTEGTTPLSLAVDGAKYKTFAVLLAGNADLNAASKDGWTPLLNAVNRGDLKMVKLLLASNADVNAATDDGWSPLHMSANTADYPAIAELLLASGADINARIDDGRTPLHSATSSQSLATLKVLLKAKANPDTQDNVGWTPLMDAANFGNQEITKALLDAGANPNLMSSEGMVALHYTVIDRDNQKHDYQKIAELLVNAGADINATTKRGVTTLSLATMNAKPYTFGYLLAASADPNIADEAGWTPLMYAVETANIEFAKALVLSKRADLNIATPEGVTALHLTAEGNNKNEKTYAEITCLLLLMGADTSAKDEHGLTPLMLASLNRKQLVVNELLEWEMSRRK